MSKNESQKKRAYLQRVVNVERGAFTPLVFSTNGLCGRECLRALKNLVGLIVMHHSGLQYSLVMNARSLSFWSGGSSPVSAVAGPHICVGDPGLCHFWMSAVYGLCRRTFLLYK